MRAVYATTGIESRHVHSTHCGAAPRTKRGTHTYNTHTQTKFASSHTRYSERKTLATKSIQTKQRQDLQSPNQELQLDAPSSRIHDKNAGMPAHACRCATLRCNMKFRLHPPPGGAARWGQGIARLPRSLARHASRSTPLAAVFVAPIKAALCASAFDAPPTETEPDRDARRCCCFAVSASTAAAAAAAAPLLLPIVQGGEVALPTANCCPRCRGVLP